MTLHEEIHQQPAVLRGLLRNRGQLDPIVERWREAPPKLVFIAARGTSDHAALYAKYVWGARLGIPVALATPSLFTVYDAAPRMSDAWVLGISQSGASPDISAVVREGRAQGNVTLAITNTVPSPLADIAELVLPIDAGHEGAVAATKTYTAQLMRIAMMATAISGDQNAWATMDRVPEAVEAVLGLEDSIREVAGALASHTRNVILGRGFNYCTAFELALKLKEVAYVASEPYSSADFEHGPIALVEPGFGVIAMVPSGRVGEGVHGVLKKVSARGADLVVFSDDASLREWGSHAVALPPMNDEWLTPMVSIVAGQLLAYHLAKAKGVDPDSPRGLSKVTETL